MWLSALIIATQTSEADHFNLLSFLKITSVVSLHQTKLLDDQAFQLVNNSDRPGSENPNGLTRQLTEGMKDSIVGHKMKNILLHWYGCLKQAKKVLRSSSIMKSCLRITQQMHTHNLNTATSIYRTQILLSVYLVFPNCWSRPSFYIVQNHRVNQVIVAGIPVIHHHHHL